MLWWASSWRSICLYSGTIGGCSQIAQNSEIGMSWCLDTPSTTQNGRNHGKHPVVLLERNLYGHPLAGLLWERQFKEALSELGWEKYRIGNTCSYIGNKGYFCQKMWMISKWLEKIRIWVPFGKDEKWRYWRTHIISVPRILAMYSAWMQTEWNSHWTIFEDVWITCFCWSNRKITGMTDLTNKQLRGPTMWKDMLQNCVERYCELANKNLEQLYKVSHPCLDDHQFKQEELDSVVELSEVCLQIVLTCLYLARIGRLDIFFMVRHQICKSSHKMDSGMWQTTSKDDFLHSSHKRFPWILSCGKHGTALQIGFIPRLRFCWRLWGLKINFWWCLLYFWKQNICPSELDV